jgi:hypothetical protein
MGISNLKPRSMPKVSPRLRERSCASSIFYLTPLASLKLRSVQHSNLTAPPIGCLKENHLCFRIDYSTYDFASENEQ